MGISYQLLRGGLAIDIEKESNYLTAILPDPMLVSELDRMSPVREVRPVFRSVYKVKTAEEDRDGVMDYIRTKMNARGISHHAYHPVGDTTTRYYLTDLIQVACDPGLSASGLEKILDAHGLAYVRSYPNCMNTHLLRVTASAGKNPLKVSNDLIERKEIIWAEPNLVNRFVPSYEPKDTLFKKQWHLKAWKGIELVPEADVRITAAWDITRGDQEVTVAVIDDGFDISHPDLSANLVFPKDFVDGDVSPFPSTQIGDFHGTPCAGVAIGAENGEGIVGAAPHCSFMPVRFRLSADDDLLWDIFDYAGKKADVISCSWGPVPVYAPLSQLLKDKFSDLSENGGPKKKGTLICFAAGNFNAPLNDPANRDFVWRHPGKGLLSTKRAILNGNAVHPDVLTVAASTSQNRKSAYSNWGAEVDICGPSDNFHPTDPQKRVPGRGIWTTDNEALGLGYNHNSRYTSYFGGTSSAAPLVAGIAALVRSINPDLTAKEVRDVLLTTTDKIEDKKPDPVLGHKKGIYDTKGHSEWFGYGKVNAEKAVKEALKRKGEAERPEPLEDVTAGVHIVGAMINPEGLDTLRETVSLMNARPDPVDLQGWTLEDSFGRMHTIDARVLDPGAFLTLDDLKLRLSNRGGNIRLKNRQGKLVDFVEYRLQDATEPGWTVKF